MKGEPLYFRIAGLQVQKFYQVEPDEPLASGVEFKVNIHMELQYREGLPKMLRVIVHVNIQRDETAPVLIETRTATDFEFKEEFGLNEHGAPSLPEDAFGALASIAYSTTRGVMFAKAGQSETAKIILPPMQTHDLTKLITKQTETAEPPGSTD